jgi:glutaredoxin-like protein NrdH
MLSSKVTVYTTPSCQQCEMTKRVLTKHGVEHDVVDLSQDEDALNYVRELGHSSAPIVVAGDDHWSGFRLTKLNELAQSKAKAAA